MSENEENRMTSPASCSADEAFNRQLDMLSEMYLDEKQRMDISRWHVVFSKLQKEEHKKNLLHVIAGGLGNPEFTFFYKRNAFLLPIFETIIAKNALIETMELVSSFLEYQAKDIETERKALNRLQTKAANLNRIKKKLARLYPLWGFMNEIEDIWHPKKSNGSESLRQARPNRENAILRVYNAHKEEIERILIKEGYNKDFFNVFSGEFKKYTDACRQCSSDHTTRNGYSKEKRAPRSEESKERSRQAALKTRQCRKSKRK